MNKKAQGLSLNTIIIAIIVLTVLVVVLLIFTGGIGRIAPEFFKCDTANGQSCKASCDSGTTGTEYEVTANNGWCEKNPSSGGPKCCAEKPIK